MFKWQGKIWMGPYVGCGLQAPAAAPAAAAAAAAACDDPGSVAAALAVAAGAAGDECWKRLDGVAGAILLQAEVGLLPADACLAHAAATSHLCNVRVCGPS